MKTFKYLDSLLTILLNMMFFAPMGRFQLELIYLYFPPSSHLRPVDNVVITTKGLQDRNIHILDGTTVENKDKLILSLLTSQNSALKYRLKAEIYVSIQSRPICLLNFFLIL